VMRREEWSSDLHLNQGSGKFVSHAGIVPREVRDLMRRGSPDTPQMVARRGPFDETAGANRPQPSPAMAVTVSFPRVRQPWVLTRPSDHTRRHGPNPSVLRFLDYHDRRPRFGRARPVRLGEEMPGPGAYRRMLTHHARHTDSRRLDRSLRDAHARARRSRRPGADQRHAGGVVADPGAHAARSRSPRGVRLVAATGLLMKATQFRANRGCRRLQVRTRTCDSREPPFV